MTVLKIIYNLAYVAFGAARISADVASTTLNVAYATSSISLNVINMWLNIASFTFSTSQIIFSGINLSKVHKITNGTQMDNKKLEVSPLQLEPLVLVSLPKSKISVVSDNIARL